MKSKRILAMITICMTLSLISPGASAGDLLPKTNENTSMLRNAQIAPPSKSAIIESLKERGIIPKNATNEEIDKIYEKYIKKNTPPQAKNPNSAKNNLPQSKKSLKAVPNQKWDGKSFELKPLVILMDYQDYSHNDFLNKESFVMLKMNSYEKESYEARLFGDDTFKMPTGEDFQTLNKFYKEMSGESFSLKGQVFGWYTAKNNAAYYGGNGSGGHDDQINAKKLFEEAVENVSKDPNFHIEDFDKINNKTGEHKPDGIIDQVMVIHAGRGEEMGGGSLKTDAIWPFRIGYSWYGDTYGKCKEVTDSYGKKLSADDFLVVEQDATTGLLGHEFAHIMGAPDEYGDDEPVNDWSLMASGSYAGELQGTRPVQMSPFSREIVQAKNGGNWLTEKVINLSQIDEKGIDVNIHQSYNKGNNYDVIRVNLPDRKSVTTTPPSGKKMYFSGAGNNLKNSMSTTIDLTGKQSAELQFKTFYNIDPEWDYASVEVREVGTDKWTSVAGNITTTANPNKDGSSTDNPPGRNPGNGITKSSGNKWIDAKFDLSAFANKKIELMFYFWTDSNSPMIGMFIDDIKVTADGQEIFSDDADGTPKFTLNGFTVDTGIKISENYYLLEWRNAQGQDEGLDYTQWRKLKKDPGLLVWYVDMKYYDEDSGSLNQSTGIDGECGLGIVDADQNAVYWRQGTNSGVDELIYQLRDAAFGLRKNSPLYISWKNGAITEDTHLFMNPYFDDRNDYSNPLCPKVGRNIPKLGLKFCVTAQSKDNTNATIHISK